jgi:allantoate deiminase
MQAASMAGGILERCEQLAHCSEIPDGIQRTYLSEAMRPCHSLLREWMESAGMEVTVDAVGNLRGLYRSSALARGRLIVGSHLDTVPHAGRYDGVLGVLLGLSLVEVLSGRNFGFDIELIGFSEEEGVRFSVPFIGSRALVGRVGRDLLGRADSRGTTIEEAILNFGLTLAELPAAEAHPDSRAYLEFHIEQGPVLESAGYQLGIVEAIAGQTRGLTVFSGRANHAGTTPMHLRSDALAGAAEWIVAVERLACSTAGAVATVGHIAAQPGAGNVIPGRVESSLDVRHAIDETRERLVEEIIQLGFDIAARRGLSFEWKPGLTQLAVSMDPKLINLAEEAAHAIGIVAPRMVSGAGHDAMIMAERIPSVMIFLRTPGGLSHHRDEVVLDEDIDAAHRLGLRLLEMLQT